VYCDTVVLSSGCLMIDCVHLEVLEEPITNQITASICPGESFDFLGETITEAGEYEQILLDENGCDSLVQLSLSIAILDSLEADPANAVIFVGEQVEIQVMDGFVTYTWLPTDGLSCTNCPDPIAMPASSTDYEVVVVDSIGCEQRAISSITVITECPLDQVEIPNVFTPNGDGLNDTFRPLLPSPNVKIVSLRIWNRFGEQVYSGEENAEWDGTKNGEPHPMDVYSYILKFECDGTVETIFGEISLIL
ncbi:MAG: gliding motility-associated C-terminal domain-containing protein, partial [Bacteroidota bacterium]